MPVWRFGLLTAAGSLVWNTVFVLAGFLLGESWHVVEMYADILQYVVIGAAIDRGRVVRLQPDARTASAATGCLARE